MLSAFFTVVFGLSLLPGRTPVCLRFAKRMLRGVLPEGTEPYCRRLTWIWFFILAGMTLADVLTVCHAGGLPTWRTGLVSAFLHSAVILLTFAIETVVRRRRFDVTFHTSGSTGKSKTIVKDFATLAHEVAFHRDHYLQPSTFQPSTFLSTVDPTHMYGMLWRRLLPRALGCPCDDEIIRSPEALLAKMRTAERVFLVTTPSFLDRFTSYAEQYEVPRNCVEIVTSGALLTKAVSDRAAAVFGVVPRQIFGSTETGGIASRRGDGPWEVFAPVTVDAMTPIASSDPPRLAVRSPFSFRRGSYVLGDAVALAPDRRSFRLLGRVDRLVKINEERVNLAEMEEKVRALGFADCALAQLEGEHGPYLGVVLVPWGGGALAPANTGKTADVSKAGTGASPLQPLALRKLLLPVFPKGTVPRRFRLVYELPRNAQGKVVHADVVRILASALVEPAMRGVTRTDTAFEAQVTFSPDAPYFQGHFPDAPILPGVAQLGFAVRCAERLRGASGALRLVKKMKFVHVIEPEVEVTLRLVRKTPDEFTYEYKRGEQSCASGVLVF